MGVALIPNSAMASPDYGFLTDFRHDAATWHADSMWLRGLMVSAVILGALIAAYQASQHEHKSVITAVVSIIIACLNGGVGIVFLTDYKTYERAAVQYDNEIRIFTAKFDDVQLSDTSIFAEYQREKLSLVDNLTQIRLELIEGKLPDETALADNFAFFPMVEAQSTSRLPLSNPNTADYIIVGGVGNSRTDFGAARKQAAASADSNLVHSIHQKILEVVQETSLSQDEQLIVKGYFLSPTIDATILSSSKLVGNDFSKNSNGYTYTVAKSIPKTMLPWLYADVKGPTSGRVSSSIEAVKRTLQREYLSK
jgi:hypothetical protein